MLAVPDVVTSLAAGLCDVGDSVTVDFTAVLGSGVAGFELGTDAAFVADEGVMVDICVVVVSGATVDVKLGVAFAVEFVSGEAVACDVGAFVAVVFDTDDDDAATVAVAVDTDDDDAAAVAVGVAVEIVVVVVVDVRAAVVVGCSLNQEIVTWCASCKMGMSSVSNVNV